MSDHRYMLRLIELWILWVVGELDAADEAKLKEIEPKLQKTWGYDGAWYEVIPATLHLPESLSEQLRGMWERNLETARQEAVPPPKEMFAKSIARQIAGLED